MKPHTGFLCYGDTFFRFDNEKTYSDSDTIYKGINTNIKVQLYKYFCSHKLFTRYIFGWNWNIRTIITLISIVCFFKN